MEKQPIPTAESIIDQKGFDYTKYGIMCTRDECLEAMEEYAIVKSKYYVREALKAAAENAYAEPVWNEGRCDFPVNKNSILNAYPLDNIK